MASMETTKVFAAALTAGIAFMVTGMVSKIAVPTHMPEKTAIKIDLPQEAAPAQAPGAAPAGPESVLPLLANADVARGQQIAQRQCAACHSFNEGGRNGVGPNLYAIIGAAHGHAEGFNYSASLKGKPGPWTYEQMDQWLYRPAAYAPGTRMAYAGLTNTQQRADVIAYLRSISPNAPPPPAAPAQQASAAAPAAAPAAAAPAPGGAPAAAPAADLKTLLANADVGRGEQLARRQCAICHTFTEGGRNGIGPNLWNTVGAPHGHAEGFNYSAALKGKQGPWTYEELNNWLRAPLAYAPGTRMAFAGISNDQQRADVILYLRSLSANPQPLP